VYALCEFNSITCFAPVTVTGKRHSSTSSPGRFANSHQLPDVSVTDP
jgi:hypothetical protein